MGAEIGEHTVRFVMQLLRLLERVRYPEHGYRSCPGRESGQRYGPLRVKAASE